MDTPALPDVEEHVFKVFSQDRVQLREVEQEVPEVLFRVACRRGAGRRLSSTVACRRGNAGRRTEFRGLRVGLALAGD